MAEPRMTRAEMATRTGISKPTVGESVRRLVAAGVVVDTGERTTGRGRVGSYYALPPGLGGPPAVGVPPAGVTAELVDARGDVVARAAEAVASPVRAARVAGPLA